VLFRHVTASAAVLMLLLGLGTLMPRVAHAHDLVDRGRDRFAQADFPGALAAVSDALHADDLTREDLAATYELRALIRLAQGDRSGCRDDLQRLATFAPDHELSRSAPPDVREDFESIVARLEGPIEVTVSATRIPDGVRLNAEVSHDGAGLRRAVRIAHRTGDGEWTIEDTASVNVVGSPDEIRYWAVVVGPGGAPLAQSGSEQSPLTPQTVGTDLGLSESVNGGDAAEGGGDDTGVIVGVVLAVVAVLAAGAITTAVLLTEEQGDQTMIGPPSSPFRMEM
jgi:hypothetical protein